MSGLSRWLQKPPLGTPINWGNNLSKGLKACYLFNEYGGNRVYNLANGINRDYGKLFGDTIWKGDDLYFDGTGDFVDIGQTLHSSAISFFTICYPTVIDINLKCIIAKRNNIDTATASTNSEYNISFDNNNLRFYYFDDALASDSISHPTTLILNKYNYICGVLPGNGLLAKLFVNGIYTTATQSRDLGTYTNSIQIGCRTSNNDARYFAGYIKLVYYWNRALSKDEMMSITNSPYQIFTSPIQSWMKRESLSIPIIYQHLKQQRIM